MNNHRGPLNATLTFAAIYAYMQAFETFGAEPLVFALGGLHNPDDLGMVQANSGMKAHELT